MSSEEYEVLYTVCSELAKKGISPGVFGAPGQFSPGACGGPGPWGFRPWGFGPGPWAFGGPGHFCPGGRRGSSLGWIGWSNRRQTLGTHQRIRQEVMTEMIKLPGKRSPRAAHAREMRRKKVERRWGGEGRRTNRRNSLRVSIGDGANARKEDMVKLAESKKVADA
ncbi:hypothetical protein GQ600_19548 [Phytophthora cactorum]|nr:hypothetical protein GQ600_19548 [Phytophthora cactorum]